MARNLIIESQVSHLQKTPVTEYMRKRNYATSLLAARQLLQWVWGAVEKILSE